MWRWALTSTAAQRHPSTPAAGLWSRKRCSRKGSRKKRSGRSWVKTWLGCLWRRCRRDRRNRAKTPESPGSGNPDLLQNAAKILKVANSGIIRTFFLPSRLNLWNHEGFRAVLHSSDRNRARSPQSPESHPSKPKQGLPGTPESHGIGKTGTAGSKGESWKFWKFTPERRVHPSELTVEIEGKR